MKKIILTLAIMLTAALAIGLSSCKSEKTRIVDEFVEEELAFKDTYEQLGMSIDVRNENDDIVMEMTMLNGLTDEMKENLAETTDKDLAVTLKQTFTPEQILQLKKYDIKIKCIYKDNKGQKIEKVVDPKNM